MSLFSRLLSGVFSSSNEAPYPPMTYEEALDAPVVPHYDYAVMSEHVYGDGTSRQLPKGWEIFLHSSELSLNREGFAASAYINHERGHVVIAKRGTIDAAGLRAGIWVYFDEPTIQFTLAEQFGKVARLKMELHSIGHYIVSYTGHSLGGVLATCRAVAEHTYAVVFETPGCRGFVEKTMHPFRYDEADIIVYVRPPNTINTLKPQVGHVVQLPPREVVSVSKESADESAQKKIAQMLPNMPFTGFDVAGFMGKKLLERSVPELYEYLSKMEPVVRDLFNETQQVHSIHNIVPLFEDDTGTVCEPEGESVSVWPSHLMQFFEFHSVQKSVEDCKADEPHLRSAYESLRNKLYRTRKRDLHALPITWLPKDSLTLISWWEGLTAKERRNPDWPLSFLDRRVLSSCWIGREHVKSVGMTGFQLKQYCFILTKNPKVRELLTDMPSFDMPNSKL